MGLKNKQDKCFKRYAKELLRNYHNESIEDSYYKGFIEFIEGLDSTYSIKRAKRIGENWPDFKAYSKEQFVGWIECKSPGTPIDRLRGRDKEQIERYKSIKGNNLLLTNFHEFILFQNGKQVGDKVKLLDVNILKEGTTPKLEIYSFQEFLNILESFFYAPHIEINNPTKLAEVLAKKAKLLEKITLKELEADKYRSNKSSVSEFHKGLKELIGEKTDFETCAEAFTETLIYGLFLAKLKLENKPLRKTNAVDQIPSQIRVIKKLFMNIYGDNLPEDMTGIVESIISVLNNSDVKQIVSHFELSDKDPFIQFYENFLQKYNPTKRKEMGVFYTPNTIVSFIVRSTNYLLKREFGRKLGLADQSVTVLDPCVGTGTFLAHAIEVGINELKKKNYSQSLITQKISEHFLKDFYGFEILVSPYILCHLKLSMVMEKEHYELKIDERIPVYLTNTLDFHDLENRELSAYLEAIRQEIEKANDVKRKKIMVVMGNPPYGAPKPFNTNEWTKKLLLDYKVGLRERNPKALSNDYIKFLRFGQYKIEDNKEGIVTFITDNSYLAGDVHTVMRKNLFTHFNEIYILNLHGNQRTSKEGTKDENVFDIKEGVAIIFLIKARDKSTNNIYYSELPKTSKQNKFNLLKTNRLDTIEWKKINPTDENKYLFLPSKIKKTLNTFNLPSIFIERGVGITTVKDDIYVSTEKEDFKIRFKDKYNPEFVKDYEYRPFDKRYLFCGNKRPGARFRERFYEHLSNSDLILVSGRSGKVTKSSEWNLVFIAKGLIDYNLFYRGGTTLFPLYYKRREIQKTLTGKSEENQLNFTSAFLNFISTQYLHKPIDPEMILHYIYAVLNSTNYRINYSENLQYLDYPSIPFPRTYGQFNKIAELGKALTSLHLNYERQRTSSLLIGNGDSIITLIKYEGPYIWINKNQRFTNISEEVWNYEIGGYRVLQHWIKDRKKLKKALSIKEIDHFGKIVTVTKNTLIIISKINKITRNI